MLQDGMAADVLARAAAAPHAQRAAVLAARAAAASEASANGRTSDLHRTSPGPVGTQPSMGPPPAEPEWPGTRKRAQACRHLLSTVVFRREVGDARQLGVGPACQGPFMRSVGAVR